MQNYLSPELQHSVAPLIAAGAALLSKSGVLKQVGSFIGGLFHKKPKPASNFLPQPAPVSQALPTPPIAVLSADAQKIRVGTDNLGGIAGGLGYSGLVEGEKGSPAGVPEVIDDWLGRATKSTREITTTVDNKILYFAGAIAAFFGLAYLLKR